MQQVIVFVREVPEAEANHVRQDAEDGAPHTWYSWSPHREALYSKGITPIGGEVCYIEDGKVIAHTLVGVKDSVLQIENEEIVLYPKCD